MLQRIFIGRADGCRAIEQDSAFQNQQQRVHMILRYRSVRYRQLVTSIYVSTTPIDTESGTWHHGLADLTIFVVSLLFHFRCRNNAFRMKKQTDDENCEISEA